MKKCIILIPILFSGCQGFPVSVGIESQGTSITIKWGEGKSPVPVEGKSPVSPEPTLESYLPTKYEPNGTALDALKPKTGLSKISQNVKEFFQ